MIIERSRNLFDSVLAIPYEARIRNLFGSDVCQASGGSVILWTVLVAFFHDHK